MKKLLFLLLFVIPMAGFAQHDMHSTNNHHEDFRKFKVSLAFAQAYIPAYHLHDEEESAQLIPVDGIDIQYNFNHRVFTKWTNELEFLSYRVKNEKGEEFVRDNAFLSVLTIGYELYNKLAVIAGVGYEFEKSKDLWVYRFGLEYTFPFLEHWELSPELLFDIKDESHTAITWGIGIGYRL